MMRRTTSMIYDRYAMAVMYKLQDGPAKVSSLYTTTSQHDRLNALMDAGIVESTSEGIALSYLGKKLYPLLLGIADLLQTTDYMDEAAHIDKQNRRRVEYMNTRKRK